MSRSHKKRPFAAICGNGSAAKDKEAAARGLRRTQNQYLHNHWDDDDFLVPHRLECYHNNTWEWSRDGCQSYQVPTAREWSRHQASLQGISQYPYQREQYAVWPPAYYKEMMRK